MNSRYAFASILAAGIVATVLAIVSFVGPATRAARAADTPRKQIAYLGARLVDVSPEECRRAGIKGGARIVAIDPGSPADKEDLREGDIITEFEGQPVTAAYQVYGKIRRMRVGELASMHFHREGSAQSLALLQLGGVDYWPPASDAGGGYGSGADPELIARVDELARDVASLQRRVEALEHARRRPPQQRQD